MRRRFIHAADIHLDSPLKGLSAYEGAPVEMLRTASRAALTRLVNVAIEEAVDFMVIAGDLYDGDWPDYNTGIFFIAEMGRLQRQGIPVFLLYGNHDADSKITKQLTLPDNVHTFSSRKVETHRLENLKVALHGQSFKTAATTENLAITYPDAVPGYFNIGVLHTALEGHSAHASYAPCALPELQAKGYEYWALGHVHEHRVVSEDPWVVFPGNLQGRHAKEIGPRGAVLVTQEDHRIHIDRLFVDVLRWQHLEFDATAVETLEDLVRAVGARLDGLVEQRADGRPIALRITLKGRCRAHGELFGNAIQLRSDILAQAAALGEHVLWIEKVRVRTEPELSPETIKARADAVADLQTMLERAAQDEDFLASLGSELETMAAKAHRDLKDLPELKAIRSGELSELVQGVSPGLIAKLLNESP